MARDCPGIAVRRRVTLPTHPRPTALSDGLLAGIKIGLGRLICIYISKLRRVKIPRKKSKVVRRYADPVAEPQRPESR